MNGYTINLEIRKVDGANFNRLYTTVTEKGGVSHNSGSFPAPERDMAKAVRYALEDAGDVIASLIRKQLNQQEKPNEMEI